MLNTQEKLAVDYEALCLQIFDSEITYVANDTFLHATVLGSMVKVSGMMQRGMSPIRGYKSIIE